MEDICRHKVVFIGDCSVGKTCIIQRFTSKNCGMNYDATIGTDFVTYTLDVNNRKVELQIWDTAGQERYRSLIPNYIRGASCVVIVYDVTDRRSFETIDSWFKEVPDIESTLVYIVGNKVDCVRNVSTEEGMQKSSKHCCSFVETSALKDIGVSDLFEDIATNLLPLEPKSTEAPLKLNEPIRGGCC